MRLAMIALAAALTAGAHDIPNDVTVQALLKPEGQRLRLLVRAPMKAMRDVEFPQKGPGYLDLSRTSPLLADAATLWISDAIALYEGDVRLPKPTTFRTMSRCRRSSSPRGSICACWCALP